MDPVWPPDVVVFERGWLSSNNVLMQGEGTTALVDSGYCTHAEQTVALVAATLHGRPLDLLLATHTHSDHCGGHAAMQARYPEAHTLVPQGQYQAVLHWDAVALGHSPTGQQCPPFRPHAALRPGSELPLGQRVWQVHAAPGHEAHAVLLFEPQSRVLVSGDALWQQGFGVVFPELDGIHAFDDVATTLDLIERLQPHWVIPGHGPVFTQVPTVIAHARQRLHRFVHDPEQHRHYAAKVLLKFKLLECGCLPMDALVAWACSTAYMQQLVRGDGAPTGADAVHALVRDLERSGAARVQGGVVFDGE